MGAKNCESVGLATRLGKPSNRPRVKKNTGTLFGERAGEKKKKSSGGEKR